MVTSIYPSADRPEAGVFVARRVDTLRARGVVVTVAAAPFSWNPWRRHAAILWRALSARGPFDGVEGHVLFPGSLVALLVARLRSLPLVVYAHGHDVAVAARRSPLHRALASVVARGASRVVANSADTASYVAALGADAVVIPPGVDLERFRPGDRGAARLELDVDDTDLLAVFVGILNRTKGADVFAEALSRLSGWRGVLVGQGGLAPMITASHPTLLLVGAVEPAQVARWMLAADVVVCPSRREALGLAAIEALACGTPVVASDVGGLREVIRDGVNGVLIPPGDPKALVVALRRLEDGGERARLGEAARRSVLPHALPAASAAMAALWDELGVRT